MIYAHRLARTMFATSIAPPRSSCGGNTNEFSRFSGNTARIRTRLCMGVASICVWVNSSIYSNIDSHAYAGNTHIQGRCRRCEAGYVHGAFSYVFRSTKKVGALSTSRTCFLPVNGRKSVQDNVTSGKTLLWLFIYSIELERLWRFGTRATIGVE